MEHQQTLKKVIDMLGKGGTHVLSDVPVYVVNYEAKVPYPRKFWYNACTGVDKNGLSCGKSVDGAVLCEHHRDHVDKLQIVKRYRFDVFIFDAAAACEPVKATIFDAAATLLGISVSDFSSWSDKEQAAYIHSTLLKLPVFDARLRVSKGNAYIVALNKKVAMEAASPQRGICGPCSSPMSTTRASSSGPRGTLSNVAMRDKVAKVAELLTATFLEEVTYVGEEDGSEGH